MRSQSSGSINPMGPKPNQGLKPCAGPAELTERQKESVRTGGGRKKKEDEEEEEEEERERERERERGYTV